MRGRAGILAAPLAGSAAGYAALFWAGRGGWRGAPNDCVLAGDCYCELIRPGAIAQPANTGSALAFTAVGVWIAWRALGRGGPRNPMHRTRLFPALYALLVALVGPGTMALHATVTRWGGQADSISMYLLGLFFVLYALHRLGRLSEGAFLPAWALAAALLAASKLLRLVPTEPLFGALLLSGLYLERRAFPRGPAPRLWAAAGLGAAAFLIWCLSHGPGPLCVPDSLLQGHAVWHVLTALAAGAMYLHYESEPAR